METRGRSRSKTPFTEVDEFAKEFIEKGSFTQKTVTRSTRSNTYRTEESSVRSNDEVTSVIDKPIRKSTRLERSVRKVYKTSDYSSEDGEAEATSTKIKSQNNKNQLIEDARAAANGNSEVSALDLYKKSGRYWDIYPKTDWTYSPHSKDRVELAPGVVAMPNMSRKTIHSVHSTDQTQVDYAHKETNTETLLRQRTSVFGEYQPKQLFNNNHEYGEHRKISYTYSQWQRIRRLLVTILTTVVTVSHFLFRVQTFFMAKVHKFTSRVMLLDTWLLWKNGRTTNKTTKLIALCVVPLLLLGGWYILTNLGSILYTFYFNSTSLATATPETTDSQINPIFIEPPNDKNNEELKPTPKIASNDYLEAISELPPDLKGLDIENLVANIAQSSGFQEITRKLDSTTGSLAEELRKLKEQLEELDKQRLEDSLVIAQLKQQNNLNNFQLSKCCKRPVLDVSGYVKALLNDEGFLKSQKGFNEYLREAFAAKHELESQLGNLTARLSTRLDAAVDESSLRLMEEVSQRLTGSPQGVLSEEQVRRIVKNVLKVYDADKTGLVDYAMETMGGQVLSTRCTENYLYGKAVVSLLGVPLWYPINSPRTVITPSTNPGECWAFQNFPGFVVVRLSKRVQVEAVSLEHISRLLAPDGDISSAPKEVQVLGLRDEDDKQPVELGEFVYDVEGEPLQFFETRRVDQAFEIVELRVMSNHGNPNYTCLYRFRVHGKSMT